MSGSWGERPADWLRIKPEPETKCLKCHRDWTYDSRYSTKIYVRSCEPCGLIIDQSEFDGIGENAKRLIPALNVTKLIPPFNENGDNE